MRKTVINRNDVHDAILEKTKFGKYMLTFFSASFCV